MLNAWLGHIKNPRNVVFSKTIVCEKLQRSEKKKEEKKPRRKGTVTMKSFLYRYSTVHCKNTSKIIFVDVMSE